MGILRSPFKLNTLKLHSVTIYALVCTNMKRGKSSITLHVARSRAKFECKENVIIE